MRVALLVPLLAASAWAFTPLSPVRPLLTRSSVHMQAGKPKKDQPSDSPAVAFEKLAAPFFVPPSRPDLKEKYQSANPSGASKTAPRPTKRTVSAVKRAAKPTSYKAAKPSPVQMKRAMNPSFSAKADNQAANRAARNKGKPSDTPAVAFEKLVAPLFVPPSRPDLKAKYQPTPVSKPVSKPRSASKPVSRPVSKPASVVPAKPIAKKLADPAKQAAATRAAFEKRQAAAKRQQDKARPAPRAAPQRKVSVDPRFESGGWNPAWKQEQDKATPKPLTRRPVSPPKPTSAKAANRAANRAAKAGDSPAVAFEKLAAPIFVPPSRPDLVAKYQDTKPKASAPSSPAPKVRQPSARKSSSGVGSYSSGGWNPAWKQEAAKAAKRPTPSSASRRTSGAQSVKVQRPGFDSLTDMEYRKATSGAPVPARSPVARRSAGGKAVSKPSLPSGAVGAFAALSVASLLLSPKAAPPPVPADQPVAAQLAIAVVAIAGGGFFLSSRGEKGGDAAASVEAADGGASEESAADVSAAADAGAAAEADSQDQPSEPTE